jgi:hypothetical protein
MEPVSPGVVIGSDTIVIAADAATRRPTIARIESRRGIREQRRTPASCHDTAHE